MKETDFTWTEIATAQDGSRREYAAPLVAGQTLYRLISGSLGNAKTYWLGSWAGMGRTLAEIEQAAKAAGFADNSMGTGK